MEDIFESLRVGGCCYSSGMVQRHHLSVQLWGLDKSDSERLSKCGEMRMEGSFRGKWRGQTDMFGQSVRFDGTKRSGILESANYERIPVSIEFGLVKAPRMVFQTADGNWEAVFPKTMMLEGDRSHDKHVRIFNKGRQFDFCIFPAEFYGHCPSSRERVLLPGTYPVLKELHDDEFRSNRELFQMLITIGLLGFSFYA